MCGVTIRRWVTLKEAKYNNQLIIHDKVLILCMWNDIKNFFLIIINQSTVMRRVRVPTHEPLSVASHPISVREWLAGPFLSHYTSGGDGSRYFKLERTHTHRGHF